jgi:hypothetical protein
MQNEKASSELFRDYLEHYANRDEELLAAQREGHVGVAIHQVVHPGCHGALVGAGAPEANRKDLSATEEQNVPTSVVQ